MPHCNYQGANKTLGRLRYFLQDFRDIASYTRFFGRVASFTKLMGILQQKLGHNDGTRKNTTNLLQENFRENNSFIRIHCIVFALLAFCVYF